jgi:two-component system response regulator NreC
MRKIRVLVADDHAVLRAGLRMLINAQPDMEVVGEAADSHEAAEQVQQRHPDVLTLDLTMPGGSSIKLIERLRQELPRTRVLVLTMHDDPAYLRAVLAAGGAGYVIKSVADTALMGAIRAVCQGRIVVDVNLPPTTIPAPPASPADIGAPCPSGFASLSSREREVLRLVAQGHTNQEIAHRLFLSVKTIETYRGRIAHKLGLRSRAELVRYALEIGLLGLGKSYHESPAG